ncbi:S24 family peptidase [Pseudovibrio sp. Tun.PSC04-5.I4]|uniref:LexA family transcriptional regulator n=1 Tax=Pseudovibrio sp. Tun.PSC04-5.I4 TaxID=1798213 RepID=UPI00088E1D1D|nr:S24 family peptidase [Pseudovibrio sp. Tun.PSC04-5.I4]SDR16055.1 Phage repressor protein C, contains Cro/C1-type HTH and peptisase s24 domains [Pseudovibrio sp. Tun.PSC04-5.I4]
MEPGPTHPTFRIELGRRIEEIVGKYQTKSEAAEIAGVSVEQLNKWISGKVKVPVEGVHSLAAGMDIDLSWVFTGVQALTSKPKANVTLKSDFTIIPRVNVHLAAGSGTLNGDTIENLEDIPFTKSFLGGKLGRTSTDGLIILTADGDSMDPLIADGDLVMVDKKRNTLSDGVYAFVYGGLARVKYLRPTLQGDIEVISQNPIHKDELLKRSELEDFHIIGKVVWCGHRFN